MFLKNQRVLEAVTLKGRVAHESDNSVFVQHRGREIQIKKRHIFNIKRFHGGMCEICIPRWEAQKLGVV